MKNIIDIHGQYDNQTLMDTEFHTKYLDKFIGTRIAEIHKKYVELYTEYIELNKMLKNNYGDEIEKQRKLDLLQYQYKEIKAANLKNGEDEQLEEKRKIIMSSEKVAEALNIVSNNLEGNIIDVVNDSIRALEKIEDVNSKYSEKLVEMKNIYYEVQEVARDISSMKEDIYFDERERNEIEERLDEIYSLKKKYGNTIEKILDYKEELEKEIDRIENLDEENRKTKEKIEKIVSTMEELCKQIEELRAKNSKILNEKINEELVQLEMKNARFNAKVIEDGEFSINGKSHVEFVITTNLGEEEKKLNKIASGGEMSRIMLAIKTVLSDIDEVPVLIFDEIDTGISGKAANSVGSKLKKIAKKHQVIIVTHLATIAAQGDYNYYIYKEVAANKTNTNVKLLNESETIREIARIASGEITEKETVKKDRVISEETSKKVLSMMQSVVAEGTGKNAQVQGYSIGGKTGTSEDGVNTGKYVTSFIGTSPIENPQVCILITLYNPTGEGGHQGGGIAAPIASQVLGEVLPYLEIKKQNEEEQQEVEVPNIIGLTVKEAKKVLEDVGLQLEVKESEDSSIDTITNQLPKAGIKTKQGTSVVVKNQE